MGKSEVVTFSSGKVWADESTGILRVEFAPGTHQNVQVAREVIASIRELNKEPRWPALVDIANVKGLDRDARTYYGSSEAMENWAAVAMLTSSPLTNTLANIWLAVFRTISGGRGKPTKIFDDESSAIEWLKGFRS
ncbi:MAG TPA: hypothetical protein VL242_32490 [Sorangium sp.]|uniref:DUF7793 family protein n=1 Tax=Sorangium sp. So ce1153 TaxID=3133333 RepID=UPI002BD3EBBC|nr:hypothetical protein [Sorangium sp.]